MGVWGRSLKRLVRTCAQLGKTTQAGSSPCYAKTFASCLNFYTGRPKEAHNLLVEPFVFVIRNTHVHRRRQHDIRSLERASSGFASGRLGHVHLFFFGWAYYIATPVSAGLLGLFDSIESASVVAKYFDRGSQWLYVLVLYSLAMPFAFVTGSKIARAFVRPSYGNGRSPLGTGALLIIYVALLIAFTIPAREFLFSGYTEGQDSNTMGPIATVQMILLFQLLYAKAAGLRTAGLFLMATAFSSTILMGMGGRLYVISTIVAIYVFWWNYSAEHSSSRRRSLILMGLVPLFLALVGMWRVGESDLTLLAYYVFAEPLLTSISAFTFIFNGTWSLVEFPADFLSSIVNIVPTIAWPDKAQFIVPLATDFSFDSPFGALSIIASSIGNFGIVGGFLFFMAVGFLMGRLQRSASTPLGIALYLYTSSLIPFIFFRDPFQIQVKLVLTGFILVVINLILFDFLPALKAASRNRSTRVDGSV